MSFGCLEEDPRFPRPEGEEGSNQAASAMFFTKFHLDSEAGPLVEVIILAHEVTVNRMHLLDAVYFNTLVQRLQGHYESVVICSRVRISCEELESEQRRVDRLRRIHSKCN